MTRVIEIFREFTFEAAHHLAVNVDPGHPYSRLHGHSFRVEVYVRGEPGEKTRWVCDFADIQAQIDPIRDQLDHHYLNEIPGLETPTLETISQWLWDRLKPALPGLSKIVVRRGSCAEGCVLTDA